jgi:hypothetical protein
MGTCIPSWPDFAKSLQGYSNGARTFLSLNRHRVKSSSLSQTRTVSPSVLRPHEMLRESGPAVACEERLLEGFGS